MPLVLSASDMFGLTVPQQQGLTKIVTYLENKRIGGAVAFPEIPYDLFFGFNLLEAENLRQALGWEWANSTTNKILPGHYATAAFDASKMPTIHKMIKSMMTAGIGR